MHIMINRISMKKIPVTLSYLKIFLTSVVLTFDIFENNTDAFLFASVRYFSREVSLQFGEIPNIIYIECPCVFQKDLGI